MEKALGEVESQELLPDYDEGDENLIDTQNQSFK